MALASRCFYQATIDEFLQASENDIISPLSNEHLKMHHALLVTQIRAWQDEISLMKELLHNLGKDGYICFEYNIPRMGRRIDVVVLIKGIVLVLEFKAFKEDYTEQDITQVCDYGLDLKNFHEESHNRFIVPILVSTSAKGVENEYKCSEDRLFLPLLASSSSDVESIINYVLDNYSYGEDEILSNDDS